MRGRPCRVSLAVDRESAGKLRDDEKRSLDRRHLYLLEEGQIVQSSKGKSKSDESRYRLCSYGFALVEICFRLDVPEGDKLKREKYHSDNKKKLLNPLFFVSPVRLSIRNLSKEMNDSTLRTLCVRAVKAGLEANLVRGNDMRALHISEGRYKLSKEDLSVPTFTPKAVKRCKVMLELERMKSGKPQSKGFSFVEFTHHAFALACLRELNNNPSYVDFASSGKAGTAETPIKGLNRPRLIVEFSIENKRKVMALEARGNKSKMKVEEIKESSQENRKRKTNESAGSDNQPEASDSETARPLKRTKVTAQSKDAKKSKIKHRREEKEHKRKVVKRSDTVKTAEVKKGSTWGGHKRLRAIKKRNMGAK